ncbi:MAG: hypothetical protein IJG24_08565 [Selenomonadaceae bacterium]|nr:hypothetical protein [Selenomonadaceae bacterium]
MNRPIKFRGVSLDTGEFIYGDLRIIGIRPHIFKEAQCYYDEELIEVGEDSVAQLVGYDCDGREVYEGDKIFHTMSNHESFAEYGDNPAYLKLTKLKEVTT